MAYPHSPAWRGATRGSKVIASIRGQDALDLSFEQTQTLLRDCMEHVPDRAFLVRRALDKAPRAARAPGLGSVGRSTSARQRKTRSYQQSPGAAALVARPRPPAQPQLR